MKSVKDMKTYFNGTKTIFVFIKHIELL